MTALLEWCLRELRGLRVAPSAGGAEVVLLGSARASRGGDVGLLVAPDLPGAALPSALDLEPVPCRQSADLLEDVLAALLRERDGWGRGEHDARPVSFVQPLRAPPWREPNASERDASELELCLLRPVLRSDWSGTLRIATWQESDAPRRRWRGRFRGHVDALWKAVLLEAGRAALGDADRNSTISY